MGGLLDLLTGRFYRLVLSVLVVLLFVATNLVLTPMLGPVRIDLTNDKLYTLSQGTRATLAGLSEPVELTFVYADGAGQAYPDVRAYADRIRELLASYKAISGGQLIVHEIDPLPFSPAEDAALAAGITGLQTDRDDPLYFGLIGRNLADDERIIPFLNPEREATLEYDLTRMIARLDKPAPARIGIISSLNGMSGTGQEEGYFVLREIAKSFEIEPLSSDFVQIPSSVDVLLIAHPEPLNERQLYLVDQFLMSRGRALIFLDPASKAAVARAPFGLAEAARSSGLGSLEAHLGVSLSKDAVADATHALPVFVEDDSGRRSQLGQPLFMAIGADQMSGSDLVTSSLARAVNFGAPGALMIDGAAALDIVPLVATGPAPSFIDATAAAGDMHPRSVIAAYEGRTDSLVLAARLSGALSSAFSGPVLPGDTGDAIADELAERAVQRVGEHLSVSQTPVELVIVADSDLLDDGFYIDPASGTAVGDNASFVLNALDHLAGGQDLVGLRSRASSLRPMTRVQALRTAAEERYIDEQARLQGRLSEAIYRLEQLQSIGSTDGFYAGDVEADLTPSERDELRDLRANIVGTRERLRQIERDFRSEIDGLERVLVGLNVWAAPFLVALFGLWMSLRRRRRARGRA